MTNETDTRVRDLEQQVAERDATINRLTAEIKSLRASRNISVTQTLGVVEAGSEVTGLVLGEI